MKVDVTALGSYQKKLQFTFPATKVKDELESAFRNLARRVKVPGFRPGKAPRTVLEARYGAQIREDVANSLIQQGWTDVLAKNTVTPVGRPAVDATSELAPQSDFEFSILVEVRPELTLETIEGVEVVYPAVEVTDDEVEAAVRSRLEGQSRLVEVSDRGVKLGDMVLVELEAKDGDTTVSVEAGTMVRTEADPYYPGLEAHLEGMAKDEAKTAEVTFGTSRLETISGRTLTVTLKVLSIQANEVPALTDELAGELGFEGGTVGMRAALAEKTREQRDEVARIQARANLLEALIAANPFDVPQSLVDQSFQMLMEELRMQQAFRGVDPRTMSFNDATLRDLRARAEFAAKAGLILETVSKNQSITVADADVEAKLQELADSRGQTIEAVRGYFQRDGADDELRERILEEKTLDWLLERANVVTAKAAEPTAPAAKAAKAVAESVVAAEVEAKGSKKAEAAADLSVLDGAVGAVKEALDTGAHDASLQALLDAENAGKGRKGVVSAIEKRLKDIG